MISFGSRLLNTSALIIAFMVPGALHAQAPRTAPAKVETGRDALDEAALLDAAYDRVSMDALQTIDDMTPRAREITLLSSSRSRTRR